MSFNNISSSMSGLFQSTFSNSLLKSQGGISGTLAGGSSLGGLGFGGLTGGAGGGTASVGSNPVNPLQGASALSGLNQFVSNILATNAQRKAGLLPPTGSAAGGAAGLGDAQSLSSLVALMNTLQSTLGAQGGAVPTAAPAAAPAVAGDVSSLGVGSALGVPANVGAGDAQTLGMLLGMLSSLQAMLGGQGLSGSTGVPLTSSLTGGASVSPLAVTPTASLGPTTSGLSAIGFNGALSNQAGMANGAIFQKIGDNFASIDSAINQTLGSIQSTLPLVKL